MLAWKKAQRLLTLALALALLLCCVPALAVPAAAADTELYLYNGVELPDINSVWTGELKQTYLDAFIFDYNDAYRVFLCESITYILASEEVSGNGNIDIYLYGKFRQYKHVDGVWEYWSEGGTSDVASVITWGFHPLIWVSKDVPDENGSTYLAASVPVPVNPPSSISSVSIVSPGTVQAGLYIVASVDVAGTGDFDSSATLSLSGNTSSDTYLEKGDVGNNWTLFCGEDEAASSLTVTAASVQDPSVTASKTITVEHPAVDPTDPTIPEGEAPIPTEENPTEPGEDIGGDSSDGEKDEATDEGNQGVGDLTEAIPDYSEGFMAALQDFTSAMSYTGTEAKLKIPAVMVPSLGDLVPGFQMMEEMELDFGAYVRMMPSGLMTLAQSLLTIALIVYCFKELYDTISYFLTLKGGSA